MSNITTCTFNIVKLIYSSPILYSHGTRVWIVKDQQSHFYMLKDSWILEVSTVSEIQLIRHIEKTIGQDLDGYLF
jgi:Fungal protein kinase